MNRQEEVRTFVTTRRARVRPEQVGLQDFGGERRVPGLRRAEVARLAGMSVDYYTRLERGRIEGASDSMLQSVARALRLDDTERAHLFDLARGRGWTTMPGSRRPCMSGRPYGVCSTPCTYPPSYATPDRT